MSEIQVLEYLDPHARSPFAAWFEGLNAVASAKVAAALYQLAAGNWSNVRGVGTGVFERKIDAGPGYRIYFGKDGDRLVILWQVAEKLCVHAEISLPCTVRTRGADRAG